MFLARILEDTRAELAERQRAVPAATLLRELDSAPPARPVVPALRGEGIAVIAEIKRASPSKGVLRTDLDPAKQARLYAEAGAAAISVLTEPRHFLGSLDDLRAVRKALDAGGHPVPILRKDFVIDDYQLVEARLAGADAVLLIAAALDDAELAHLFHAGRELGLTPLVEVHNEAELRRVLPLHPPLVGINNRDLRTFQVDLATTARLCPLIPPACTIVAESGIRDAEDMRRLAGWGVKAVLIGEALVRAKNPGALLAELREAGG